MPQADNVVTFPLDERTTDFLKDASGSPVQKLGAVALRLEGLEAIVALAKGGANEIEPSFGRVLFAIEQVLHDCLGLIDAEPVR